MANSSSSPGDTGTRWWVSVIDGATNTVTATIDVGRNPLGVGVDPSTHGVYVANEGSGSVSVITTLPTVSGSTPGSGSSGNPVTAAPTAAFSEAVVPSSVSFTVKDLGGNTVAGSVSLNSSDTTATFTPSSALAQNTTYTATVSGARTIPGGTMSSPYSWTFSTTGSQCPCTIFSSTAQPAVASASDTMAGNLGVQFTPSVSGWIAGIRFYKGPGNTGTHVGELWTAGGTLLGQVTFTGESASGWQEADFSSPIAVTAGTTYVASYFDPNGGYAYTAGGLASAVTNGPLTAPASSSVSGGNGVYNYSGSPSFPDGTYNAANYWVDVDFTMLPGAFAPTVTGSTPGNNSSGNPVTVAPTATFSQAVVPSSVSFTVKDSGGNAVAGSVSLNSDSTVATFTPSGPLTPDVTYTATVSGAQTIYGGTMSSPYSWTFTTAGSQCPCTLWPSTAQPAIASASDPGAGNLGVQFTPSASGWLAGIRFYKGASNTGTHVGDLWTAGGTLLGQVTFTGESASGWQEADFSSPIAVTAGTTYVASYFDPNGGYAVTPAGFASAPVTNGPLTAPQSSAVSGGNGVYNYSGSPSFPNATYNANNYWVDVDFTMAPGAFAPTVTGSAPGNTSQGNPVTAAPTVTFSQAVAPSSVSFTMKDSGGNNVAGTASFNAGNTVATFTPSVALAADTTYTATVSGAQNGSGATMSSPYSWSFTTAGSQCPCTLFPSTSQPAIASANDPGAGNLGVQFTPSASGWVAGIRFYKGASNTGTHVGDLWTAGGTLLGQVTFTGESASGWREADFSSPIAVAAGTTYVASYFDPNGGYSVTPAGFASAPVTNGPLTAPQSSAVSGGNGVYNYSGSPSFPNATYNANNYWVDVVFTQP